MLRGGRGLSPKASSQRENASVAVTSNRAGLWPALAPGQRWRLAASGACPQLTRAAGGGAAPGRQVRLKPWRALAQAQVALPALGAFRGSGEPPEPPADDATSGGGGGGYTSDGGALPSSDRDQLDGRVHADAITTTSSRSGGGAAAAGRPHGPRGGGAAAAAGNRPVGRSGSRRRRAPAAPHRPPPAALSDERVAPLMRKAERDLLPDGTPNTPWRRLAYQLRLAPSIGEVLAIYRANRDNEAVWKPHMTALTLTRTGALMYPKAVAAAAAAAAAEGRTDSAGRFPQPGAKRDAISLLESLSGKLNKLSVRQIQGMHAARVLVCMAWLEATGAKCDALAGTLVRELQRQGAGKLAQVAAVDPPLFGRLVRALAQLAPGNGELWVDLQRVTLAALLEAKAAGAAAGGRVWLGPGRDGGGAAAAAAGAAAPLAVDASTADLANLAFGFAAAGAATPQLFDALREAVLARELPPDPDALARLMCAWGRTRLPPGPLLYRIPEAFLPLLATAPPRPIGRLVWSLGMMGVRDERLLRAAAKAIVGRRLVFSSPQELVNVVWAYAHLGWRVEDGAEPLRPAAAAARRRQADGWEHRDGEEEEEEGDGDGAAGRQGRGVEASDHAGPSRRSRQQERQSPLRNPVAASDEDRQDKEEETAAAAADNHSNHAWTGGPDGRSHSSGGGGGSESEGPRGSSLWDAQAGGARSLSLRPLPLSAALAAGVQARRAMAAPPPDYPERFALFRYLGRTFIHREIGSTTATTVAPPSASASTTAATAGASSTAATRRAAPGSRGSGGGFGGGGGGGDGSAAHHTISHSQLAVLVGSFARAGYRSRQLFYTTARIALLRMPYLSPSDLTLILSAHAAVRVPHTGLFEAALPLVGARCREFSPQQLADVLWAVQALMPYDSYVQLASAIRVRRGWQAAAAAPPPPDGVQGLQQGEEEEEGADEQAGVRRRGPREQAGEGQEDRQQQQQRWRNRGGEEGGPLVPAMVRLHVPRELLEDSDWLDDEEGEGEEAALQRDGSLWGPRPGRGEEEEGDEEEEQGSWDAGAGGRGAGAASGGRRAGAGRLGLGEDLPRELVPRR